MNRVMLEILALFSLLRSAATLQAPGLCTLQKE